MPPGTVVPRLLVAAVLAVEQRKLRSGGGRELAEPTGDERGLAVAGESGDADAGEPAQRQVTVVAEVVAADVEHVGDVGFPGSGRALAGAERLGEWVGAQRPDDEAAGFDLGDADADGPPVVGEVLGLLFDVLPAGARCGPDEAFPAVVGDPPAPGTGVVDPAVSLGGFTTKQERQAAPGQPQQDQEQRAGFGCWTVLRC